jgi:signal transduction histidine kinase
VIRHVGPTTVRVAVSSGIDVLEIKVTDAGRGTAAEAHRTNGDGGSPAQGRGILGMRERCQLLGGELDAGPRPGGGFEVSARLPLAPSGARL